MINFLIYAAPTIKIEVGALIFQILGQEYVCIVIGSRNKFLNHSYASNHAGIGGRRGRCMFTWTRYK